MTGVVTSFTTPTPLIKKPLRVSLIWSSADWSLVDVARGYHNALLRAGHDVRKFPLNEWIKFMGGTLDAWRAEQEPDAHGGDIEKHIATLQLAAEKSVIDAVRHDADLVVIISGMGYHPDALYLLHKLGFKVVLICTESPYNDEQQQYLADWVDLVTVNDMTSLERIKHPNLHYLPHAYDPNVHYPREVGPEYLSDVFFVGTGFTERKELFEAVDWTGIDLKLYGYWLTTSDASPLNRYITATTLKNDEAVSWYCGTKVAPNLHRDAKGYSCNPRVFELAACGAHQLVDNRRPEVRELFGDTVCYFNGPYDFEDSIRECLADPEHRRQRSAGALERVQGHTFDARVEQLLQWL